MRSLQRQLARHRTLAYLFRHREEFVVSRLVALREARRGSAMPELLLLACVLVTCMLGCGPQWSGARRPTDNTHPISQQALTLAADARCDVPLTGEDSDLDAVELRLKRRGVTIRPRRRSALISHRRLVAAPFVLSVPTDFDGRSIASRVRSLAHEDAHYCQRETWEFDKAWAERDDLRWAFETMAEAQSWRAASLQGVAVTDEAMRFDAEGMRRSLWLYGLDDAQYFEETLRVWRGAMAR